MSRAFNGSSDSITFGAGAAPPDQGPITIIVLVKAANTSGFTGWMTRGRKTGTAVWSSLTSNNAGPKFFMESDFTNGVAGLTTGWAYYVVTKDPGAAVPRWHVKNVTAGTAFVHTDTTGGTVADGTGNITDIIVGQSFPGSFAVVAAVPAKWSDAQIEARCTLAAVDLFNALSGTGWMVRFNQASTATAVSDDTGNGGNQSALSGTTVDADNPPGYDYSLAAPPSQGSVALGLGLGIDTDGARTSGGAVELGLRLGVDTDGGRPAGGTVELGLGLGVDADGARTSVGRADLRLGLGVDTDGGRISGGAVELGLGLGVDTDGSRPSAGLIELGLSLGVDTDGGRPAGGTVELGLGLGVDAHGLAPGGGNGQVHLTLNLALATEGEAGQCATIPSFPWSCDAVPSFPGTCGQVPSFSEVQR